MSAQQWEAGGAGVWLSNARMGRGRLRRLRHASVFAALAVGSVPGCTEDDGGGGATASACKTLTALECYALTYDGCVEEYRTGDQGAREKGCASEWEATVECVSTYPSTCSGDRIIAARECSNPLLKLISCMNGGLGCDEADPCDQCACARCPCDDACIDAFSAVTECYATCEGSQGDALLACMRSCIEAAPEAFKARSACLVTATASCAECSPDGG
jgi:hypothetical protein